jgi:hypothetical protein
VCGCIGSDAGLPVNYGCGVTMLGDKDYTPRNPRLGDLIALDPSIKSVGVAHFRAGTLAGVKRIRCNPEPDETSGQRCLRMSQKVLSWVVDQDIVPRELVSEWPQIYGVGVSEADPGTIVPMAGVVGCVSGMLFAVAAQHDVGFECVTYLPREWKQGNRDKPAIKADVITRLSPTELEYMPDGVTDEWDAVGIGLFRLGRFNPVRLFHGSKPSH